MLKKEDYIYFGKFTKPHGTKGEIGIAGEGFLLGEGCDYVACDIDGILVPFFIESARNKNNDTIIVKIERFDSAESVRFLTNRATYIPREWIDEEENASWSYFVGFSISDETLGEIGEVINIDDRYFYHSPAPDWMFSLSTSVSWKRLTLSTSLRASLGNYVYNATASNNGALETMKYADDCLYNLSASYLETGFTTRQHYSDHYVENASYIKMDNLILSYDFGKIFRDTTRLSLSLMCQNVFTVTRYSGVDPEISWGMDQSFYPRPRIFSLSIGLNF